jgi:hypothetical protein
VSSLTTGKNEESLSKITDAYPDLAKDLIKGLAYYHNVYDKKEVKDEKAE